MVYSVFKLANAIFVNLYMNVYSKTKMKKILLLVGVMALMCAGFSSCKMHEDCPAYGNVESIEAEING